VLGLPLSEPAGFGHGCREVAVSDGLLRIEYRLVRRLWADPDQDQLDVWDVRLETGSFTDEDEDESGVAWSNVARATLFGMDPDRQTLLGQMPFDVADAHSGDAAYYYEHVFDVDGELLPDAAGQFEWQQGRALFLHDVRVAGDQHRRGFASLLVADAILTLAPHGTAVFAHPGPTDLDADDTDDIRHLRHQIRNTRFLAGLGFIPFRDQLWTLDLSTGDAAETLARVRRRVRS
jgi:hypothetical protein